MLIRQATIRDGAAVQRIYAPYVAGTTISLEDVPPDPAEMARRISEIGAHYPFLVAEQAGEIMGYAYASQHRTRAAYRTSVDIAIYVAAHAHRQGIGRALMAALLPAAKARGYHAAFSGIALPNPASISLHEAMGFVPVGIYREVGNKFGQWIDVGWWQRRL
ncbi:MAG: arsinothricin resistance N-acetyltransferase ArsN1 family B [Erythrobacter sp.]